MIEKLAEYAHTAWAEWMHYFLNKCIQNEDGSLTVPVAYVRNLRKQMNTPYADLSDYEKEADRDEARKILEIVIVI